MLVQYIKKFNNFQLKKIIYFTITIFVFILIILYLFSFKIFAQNSNNNNDFQNNEIKHIAEITNIEEISCDNKQFNDYNSNTKNDPIYNNNNKKTSNNCLKVILKNLSKNTNENNQEFEIILDLNHDITAQNWNLEKGQKVIVSEFKFDTYSDFFITDIYRNDVIIFFVIFYIIIVLIIGKKRGLGSLIGLFISILILFKFIIPLTLQGANPIFITLIGSIFILLPSIFLSHGFNKKTSIALVGTFIGLIITAILAIFAINSGHLTGLGSEESFMLANSANNINLDMRSILFASIIIGGIGIIDDITVSQVGIIQEIHKENPNLSQTKLFKKAMNVGKDHIASMVNTLVLAYASASMPLVLILVSQNYSLNELITMETFAEEIIRTIVASSGLVLTLPITTYIASYYYAKQKF